MSAPFRRIFDDKKAVEAIHETMDAWRNNQRKSLFNYSLFSHTSSALKDDVHDDASIHPSKKL